MKLAVIIVTLLSGRLSGLLSASSCATVGQDDASRGCFVDTERTWFLKHSLFGSAGLLHQAGACCELRGRHTVPLNFTQPLKFLFPRAGNWNIVQYSHADGHLSLFFFWKDGGGGKRRPPCRSEMDCWAPEFRCEEGSPLRSHHLADHLRASSLHQRSSQSPPRGAWIDRAHMCPHYDFAKLSQVFTLVKTRSDFELKRRHWVAELFKQAELVKTELQTFK